MKKYHVGQKVGSWSPRIYLVRLLNLPMTRSNQTENRLLEFSFSLRGKLSWLVKRTRPKHISKIRINVFGRLSGTSPSTFVPFCFIFQFSSILRTLSVRPLSHRIFPAPWGRALWDYPKLLVRLKVLIPQDLPVTTKTLLSSPISLSLPIFQKSR